MHIIPILGLSLFVAGGVSLPAEFTIELPGGLGVFNISATIGDSEVDEYGIDLGDIREYVGDFRTTMLVQYLILSIIPDRDSPELCGAND